VLDFGCGFGRLAEPISALEGVAYHGYDFSSAMVADLLTAPPPALADVIRDRVRVADTVEAAFPGECFDVIFTISVLIHNSEDQARELISQMAGRLEPEGRLVLIENRLVAATLFQNTWHAGCWVHAFADYAAGAWDVAVIEGVTAQHGVYILARPDGERAGHLTYRDASAPGDRTVDLDALRVLALSHTLDQLRGLPNGPSDPSASFDSAAQARVHDLTERNAHLERLLGEMREARTMRLRLDRTLGPLVRTGRSPTEGESASPDEPLADGERQAPAVWDADRDTRYAHQAPDFARCLHIFHQEWFGIRAASGSLPGRKLAISAELPMGGRVLSAITRAVLDSAPERIVVHGLSDNMIALTEALARFGCAERLFMIHHGAPPQWQHEKERGYLYTSLGLARRGAIRRLNVMRAGFDLPLERLFRPVLLNLSPRLSPTGIDAMPQREASGIALIPGWQNWRKNIVANAMGAALSRDVTEIWAYARDLTLPEILAKPLLFKRYAGRESGLRMMAAAELCLNVSLIDCHPMVNLEAQAVGRPCLRGPLFLDALEDHAYVRLTEVPDVSSIAAIRDRIDAVLSVPAAERRALTCDYQHQSDAVAFQRYREFLEL
jgi:SAM-dependent methyltransferase